MSRSACVAALCLLAGCTTIPHLDREDGAQAHEAAVLTLQSQGRVLTHTEAEQVLEHVASGSQARQMLQSLLPVQHAITGQALITGNDARILIDGPATFKSMLADIDAARSRVFLETFILEEDPIGRSALRHLIERHKAGVEVRIIYDAYGSRDLSREFLREARDAGIQIEPYHPISLQDVGKSDQRDHRKLLVVDGRIAYTGGINISHSYSRSSFSSHGDDDDDGEQPPAWRDTHVRISGPAAVQFEQAFLETWRQIRPDDPPTALSSLPPPQGDFLVQGVTRDGGGTRNSIYSLYIAALAHATQSAWLTQAYFAPNHELLEALKDAAHRQVDVRLLLPSVSDAPYLVYAGRALYRELLQHGVRIYERSSHNLHAKTLVVDGVWSTIGSSNLDYRSLVHNQEINAVIVSPAFSSAMQKLYEADLVDAHEIHRADWEHRPLLEKWKEWFHSRFHRLY